MSKDFLLDKRKAFWRLGLLLLSISFLAVGVSVIIKYSFTNPDTFFDEEILITVLIAFSTSLLCLALMFYIMYRFYLGARWQIIKERDAIKKVQANIKDKDRILQEQLYQDEISGLPRYFILERDYKNMTYPNVMVVEIDDYDKIATYYSYSMLLKVVSEVVKVLKAFSAKNGFKVYRMTDARFTLLKDDEKMNDMFLHSYAQQITHDLKGFEVDTDTESIDIDCTIGYCAFSEHSARKAIMALESAKSRFSDFAGYGIDIDFRAHIQKEREHYTMIDIALRENAIVPYFQPIFDANNNITKYETLVRIINKNNEVILPGVFLDYSKRIKRYKAISKKLIFRAFSILEQNPNATISINMAISDMIDNDISTFVLNKLDKSNLGSRLVVEILENEDLKDNDKEIVTNYINALRAHKVRIAIDDFGSGYSNFGMLLKIVPDFLKIDGSLIKHIHEDELSKDAVSAIVAFAKKLGVKTTAEFVCQKEVYDCCLELGIDEFQGFYLGKPAADLV